jgi:hypothetical protein
MGICSIESAAESGKRAAKLLCEVDNKKENIYLHTKKKYLILEPFKFIDSILYNNILIITIIIMIIIKTIKK